MTDTVQTSNSPLVLVVEDAADSREMLQHLLTFEGFRTITAIDGADGLALARSERPDLILTDLMMPYMTGPDMIEIIRSEPEFGRTPIVAMTAAGSGDARRAMAAGANAFVLKPLDFETLVALCNALLAASDDESSES